MKKFIFPFFLSLAATLAHAGETRFYEIFYSDGGNWVNFYQFFSAKDSERWTAGNPLDMLISGDDPYLFYSIYLDKGEAELMECDGGFDGLKHDGVLEVPDHLSYDGRDYPVTKVGGFRRNELTTVIIPGSVTEVGGFQRDEDREYNMKLQKVVMHEGVKYIYGFGGQTFDIELPSSVERIGDYAFGDCTGLKKVDLKHVKEIGTYAFNFSGLETVNIDFEGGELKDCAFFGCTSLKEVTLGGSLKAIGNQTFARSKMERLTLPAGVESIGERAFMESSIDEVCVSDGLKSMGMYAFYKSTVKRVRLSEPLATIPNNAFAGCSQLAEIQLPATVTEIDERAFAGCKSLTNVIFPSGLTMVGERAFYECESLKEIILPEGFKSYGDYAFGDCKAVETISFPSTINRSFLWNGFGCESLKDVYCQSYFSPEESEFAGTKATLHVPEPYMKAFTSDKAWSYFSEIVPLKEGDRFYIEGKNYDDGINTAEKASQTVRAGNDGILYVQGVEEGTGITVYSLSGRKLASAKAVSTAVTSIATTLKKGDAAIVRIGEKCMKVLMD